MGKGYKPPTTVMSLWIAFGHLLYAAKQLSLMAHSEDSGTRKLTGFDDDELTALDEAIKKVEIWRGR